MVAVAQTGQHVVLELTELDDGRTRLVTRVHAVYDWTSPAVALLGVVL